MKCPPASTSLPTRSELLGAVSQFVMGQAPPGSDCNKDGRGTIFVKAGEFGERFPIVCEWTTRPLKFAKVGDVLVCVVGATAGKINQAIECAIGRSVAAVRPSSELSTEYLYHFLATKVLELRGKSQGLAQGVITRDMLSELEIPLPPLAEQRRIAEVLDRAEALRAKRRAALAQLDSLTQSLLTELLRSCRELKIKSLEQIVRDMHQGINTVTEKIEYQTAGYPIIQSKHVTQGYLDLSDARFVNEKTFTKYQDKYRPEKDDLLLCNIGTIGKSLLMDEERDFLIAWNLFLIKLDNREVSPCYCKHFFDHLAGRHYFDQFLTGGTVKFISKKTLCATPIPLPPIEVQREFARRVTAVEKLKTAHRASLAELDALFASLQHRAFRGEL